MKKPTVKILITYKERHTLLQSEILTPIQSGRALSEKKFTEMIGDDTGENISHKNHLYSELSAFYWAWKNYEALGNPEYIGFMHYRRTFCFNEDLLFLRDKKYASYYNFLHLDEKLRDSFSDDKIRKACDGYDCLFPDFHITPTRNIREEYICNIPGSKSIIFDEFIKICREELPDYKEEIDAVEFGDKVQVCNMFIMKKEIFFKYCSFVFPILKKLEKRIDTSGLTSNGLRFLGYMAEKLQTIFLLKVLKENKYKIKYVNCTYIINPDNLPVNYVWFRLKMYKHLAQLFPKYKGRSDFYHEVREWKRKERKKKKFLLCQTSKS